MVPRGIDVCVCYPRVCYMLRHSLSSSLFLFGCLVSTRLGGGGGNNVGWSNHKTWGSHKRRYSKDERAYGAAAME